MESPKTEKYPCPQNMSRILTWDMDWIFGFALEHDSKRRRLQIVECCFWLAFVVVAKPFILGRDSNIQKIMEDRNTVAKFVELPKKKGKKMS